MKKLTPTLLCAALLLPSTPVGATESVIAETFSAFSRCDAGFFENLQANASAWEAHAVLNRSTNASWIAVPDRYEDKKNTIALKDPPAVAGVTLSSYFDEFTDMERMGQYLFWGFIADGSPDHVAKQLAPLLDHPESLRKLGPMHARAEIWEDGKWTTSFGRSGTVPGTRKLERVFLLEPHGANQTRVSCSLQGAVDATVLGAIRPDIPVAEYPAPAQELGFADVTVPAAVVEAVSNPLLAPKFSRLTYTYTSINDQKPSSITVELVAQGDLIHRTEIYSSNFSVQRLMKANLIQLKSKMEGSLGGRVLLTDTIRANFPANWNEGQVLRFNSSGRYAPIKARDKAMDTSATCTIGTRFPASEIFASLPGDAIRLSCDYGDRQSTDAFIEDLGVTLTLDSTSGRGRSVDRVTALEIVR